MPLVWLWIRVAAGTSLLHEPPTLRFAPEEVPPDALLQPLEVTEPMRAWAHSHVFEVGTDDERMNRLVAALSRDLPLAYEFYTGTAPEVFDSGRYNCLGLAHLVVALGRELGVDAYYVRIDQFRSYHPSGALILSSTHVAPAWGPVANIQVVDIGVVTEVERRAAHPISDERALALHYSNRGAELLLTGQTGVAREWLDGARAIDPEVPESWVNTGVALRRSGLLDEAKQAYERAISLNPNDLAAYRNLAALLDLRGDPNAARQLLDVADRASNDNPFTWLLLGDLSVRSDHAEDATRFYRRASRLDPGNPQVLAARAELALLQGETQRARTLAARALRSDPVDPRALAVSARVE